MNKKHLLIPSLFLVCCLVNCAAWRDLYRSNYCTYDGAYALGVNHATQGEAMRSNPAALCDDTDREAVNKGYREGYTKGLKTRKNIKVKHKIKHKIK